MNEKMQFISSYKPMPLQFSPSKLFFDKQTALLQKLGFLSPLSIDIYIKYSFQLVEERYFIQGAEMEGFNTDHETSEQGILYKIGFITPLYGDVKSLFINLEEMKTHIQHTIWSSVKGFPLLQWLLFLFLILLLPGTVGSFLMKINIIGIILLFGYSLFKTIKYFSATLTKNNASYQGLTVNYSQSSDTTFLNEQMLTQLQALKPLKITKVAYTGNCLYLYQAINEQPKTASDFLSALVVKEKALTEAEKAELTQKTLSYLQQPAFLSLLTVNYA